MKYSSLISINLSVNNPEISYTLAMQAKLEYDMAMVNLVIRDDVHKAAFEASRMLWDKLQGLPQQTAPNLHGKTAIEMQHILSDEINRLLTQFCDDLEVKNLI
ncbi:MAG: hypothetical protein JSR51_05325 [Proteobacteria bacterium]|nr:hypothetical protein [Pseudomonadota bacterium]